MSNWTALDSKRLFTAADALLEAMHAETSVLNLLADQPGESSSIPIQLFTPRELEEAAALLKRMGYLEGDTAGH